MSKCLPPSLHRLDLHLPAVARLRAPRRGPPTQARAFRSVDYQKRLWVCSSAAKTFRPKKNTPVGSKGLTLKRHIEATLGSGNIREAVRLPPGEDLCEWLAVNTVDFYNALSVLYGTLEEFCTKQSCPVMTAGPKYEYLWADSRARKPVRLSAPEYINTLFDWLELQLDDPAIFPQMYGAQFPANFMEVIRVIFKRLFRVYAHIYHSHFKSVCGLGEEAHLNTCFRHFMYFTQVFQLVDPKELTPLQELIDTIIR